MDKLVKSKKLFLVLAAVSCALGIAMIFGVVFFSLKLMYVPLAVSIVFVAHAFYGCPFYFIRFFNLRLCEKIVSAVENDGIYDIEKLSELLFVKSDFLIRLLNKCLEKGYLENYLLSGEFLQKKQ